MTEPNRVDTANRLIHASVDDVYRAFIDARAWVQWLPPEGMTCAITRFDAREGGEYELTLTYDEAGHGKSTDDTDVSRGVFTELVPGKRMVQLVRFESDQPEFAGVMRMSWVITPEVGDSRVTILAEDVPPGISPEDQAEGMQSTLANLARFLEQ